MQESKSAQVVSLWSLLFIILCGFYTHALLCWLLVNELWQLEAAWSCHACVHVSQCLASSTLHMLRCRTFSSTMDTTWGCSTSTRIRVLTRLSWARVAAIIAAPAMPLVRPGSAEAEAEAEAAAGDGATMAVRLVGTWRGEHAR